MLEGRTDGRINTHILEGQTDGRINTHMLEGRPNQSSLVTTIHTLRKQTILTLHNTA